MSNETRKMPTAIYVPYELEEQYTKSQKTMPLKEWCKSALWTQWEKETQGDQK